MRFVVAATAGAVLLLSSWIAAAQSAESAPLGAYRATLAAPEATDIATTPDGELQIVTADAVTTVDPFAARLDRRPVAHGAWYRPGRGTVVHGERVYRVDTDRHRVTIHDRTTGQQTGAFGGWGHGPGQFVLPRGIAVTAAGEVVVADTGNHRVQMFDTNGEPLRYWGDWGPYPGFFSRPQGVAVHGDRIFVADTDNHRIQVFDLKGFHQRQWGRHAIQPREGEGALHYPEAIVIGPGGHWAAVLETFEGRVQWFGRHGPDGDPEARVTRIPPDAHLGSSCSVHGDLLVVTEPELLTVQLYDLSIETPVLISQFGEYGAGHGRFRNISAATFDPTGRFIDVSDGSSMRLQRFEVGTRAEELQFQPFLCRFAVGVALDRAGVEPVPVPGGMTSDPDGHHYLIDRVGQNGTPRLLRFSPRWKLLGTTRLSAPDSSGRRCDPTAIAYDRWRERLYIVDRASDRILVCTRSGKIEGPLGRVGSPTPAPHSIAITEDALYITGQRQHEVVVVDRTGRMQRRWGREGLGRGQFLRPAGIAVTGDGRVIVIDHGNHRGQIFTTDGSFITAFGARAYVQPTRR